MPKSAALTIGLTIGSLDQAVYDLTNALGGELCYLEGPITDREPGWGKGRGVEVHGLEMIRHRFGDAYDTGDVHEFRKPG